MTKQKEESSTQKTETTNEKKSRETPEKEDGEGGKGGGKGGPGFPDQDEPENPDLKLGPPAKSGLHEGLTMTEAGNLIETSEDQPKLTAGDIEEMKWGPDEKDKGWGREFQKCVLKYVHNPFQMGFDPDLAALTMRLQGRGKGEPSMASCVWRNSPKSSDIPIQRRVVQARACQTCPEVCAARSMLFERWDLMELGEECGHDHTYEDMPQATTLLMP